MKARIRAGRLARTEGVLCSSRFDRPVASGKVSETIDVHTIENCQTGGFIGPLSFLVFLSAIALANHGFVFSFLFVRSALAE